MRLIEQLGSPDRQLRLAAARALGRGPVRAALSALLEALPAERDPEVRLRIAEALGALGDARAAPGLVDALADGDAHVRERAALALGLLGVGGAALQPLLDDGVRRVRLAAVISLGRLGMIEPLRRMRADPEPVVRIAAAEAMREREDR